jgi:hypothetical protein
MPLQFGNYAFSYTNSRGKPLFVPSHSGRKVGEELKAKVENVFSPDPFYYHLRCGGHVAALHAHRPKRYFVRLNLKDFYYSISRNRVIRALQGIGLARAEYYAKWSTVKNPLETPSYSLPYGFVQSPILASVVLSKSPLGLYLRQISGSFVVSVYIDDISISCDQIDELSSVYQMLRNKIEKSNFRINEQKCVEPSDTIYLFNCRLNHLETTVTDARRDDFYSVERSPRAAEAFEDYCQSVSKGNR